ncbi:type IV secretion system protein [Nocardioides humi]|uniref:Conjugal transfer protein TrbL n=1 Tax=Nocardioides humi TaxID=449461 RepID=A0ABN2AK13_9ACTN|nr:type IV secretion system protein [Nocardioides humi]
MGVCDVPVISTVCDKAGEAAASLVSAPFDWIASAMGEAAAWLFESVWAVIDTTTLVDVTSAEYVGVYNILFGVAVFLMLLFFFLQLITGLIRRDPTALSRAALGLAKSILGSFVVITLTALALEIVDQLCVGIIQASGESMESMGDKIALLAAGLTAINIGAPGVGAVITIFLAGLAIAAAFIVWMSLLIRKALLLVAIVLAPIAFSGASWDATKGWIGKWLAFVIALIVSKLVLTVVFLVAITQVSTPIDGDLASISDPIAGVVLMFIAAFAPYMTYRFVSFLGFDLYQNIGSEQDAKSALNRPIPMPTKPQGGDPKKVLDGGDSGGTGGGGGGGGKTPPAPKTQTASGGSGATGSGGAAASAGPAAAVVVGTKVTKDAATAGPKAGQALGGHAESTASGANQQPSSAPPPPPVPKPPHSPTDGPAGGATSSKGGDRA